MAGVAGDSPACPGPESAAGVDASGAVGVVPDDAAAEAWFAVARRPKEVRCSGCGSRRHVVPGCRASPSPYRCRACRRDFSVKTGTLMHGSNLRFSDSAVAIYLLTTGIKGTSSMKLRRDLGVTPNRRGTSRTAFAGRGRPSKT